MKKDYVQLCEKTLLKDKVHNSSTDPIKKAVAAEKKHLKELADEKRLRKQEIADYFNSLPSRVKIIDGSELVIKPESRLKNIRRYIKTQANLGWFFAYFGLAIGFTAAINHLWPELFKYFGYYFPTYTPIHDLIDRVVQLILLMIFGIKYLRGVFEDLSSLNETFHLKISGKNFMVHSNNPNEPIAAASKMDSDGQPNIWASINEEKGAIKIEWAYGPDINNLITGERKFQAWMIPGVSKPYDFIENVTFGLVSADSMDPPPLNLKDIDTVRKFFKDNKITIDSDRRINE